MKRYKAAQLYKARKLNDFDEVWDANRYVYLASEVDAELTRLTEKVARLEAEIITFNSNWTMVFNQAIDAQINQSNKG